MAYKKPDIAKDLQVIEIDLRGVLDTEKGRAAFKPIYNRVCGLMAAMEIEPASGLWQIEDSYFRESSWRRRDYRSAEEVEAYRVKPEAKLALFQPDTDRMLIDEKGEVMTFTTFEEASEHRDRLNAVLMPADGPEALRERVRGG